MASNLKVDIVKPTATNGSLSLKGDSGGSATTNGISVDSSGNTSITGSTTVDELNADNIRIDGNAISSTNTNGYVELKPNGTGDVLIQSAAPSLIVDPTGATSPTPANTVAKIVLNNGYNLRSGVVFQNNGTATNASFGLISEQTSLSLKTTSYEITDTYDNDLTTDWTERVKFSSSGNIEVTGAVKTDTINEKTSGAGVTVDGVLLKDNTISSGTIGTDTINEKTSGAGVTVDGVLLKDSTISSGTIGSSVVFPSFVGMICAFAVNSAPTGWFACDGSAVNRTTYENLFNSIGTVWGVGDGSTTFNLPDLRGAFLRGTGSHGSSTMANANAFAGPSVGSFENDQIQKFKSQLRAGSQNVAAGGSSASLGYDAPAAGTAVTVGTLLADGYGTPRSGDETRPFNAGILYCIKF